MMAGDAPCPDPEVLRHFASGQLPEAQSLTLKEHVQDCSSCTQILAEAGFSPASRVTRDLIAAGLRPVSTITEHVEPFRLPPNLFPKTTEADLRSQSTPASNDCNTSAPTAIYSTENFFDLLAPPQKFDEIGRLGGYRILNVLGEGGMGVVFKAEDPRLKRPVALKVMKPEKSPTETARERFKKEGEAAALLQHDHIVTIYQVDEERGIPFLAMQFLEGESLDDRLKRVGKLPVAEIIRIAREAAEGLSAAHEKGLIHRDIKPANIWLETLPGAPALARGLFGGRVKILDFGLARQVGEYIQHLTQTGMVVGTPDYMAPEQARSGQVLDCRCDLFSLGSVMYRMGTGRKPFQGDDVMGTLLALAMEDPAPPRFCNPEIPPELSDMIRWLMAKTPADRPRSAQDVLDSLTVIERNLAEGTEDFPEIASGMSPSPGSPSDSRRPTFTAPGINPRTGSRTSLRHKSAPSTLAKFGLSPVEPTRTVPPPPGPPPEDPSKSNSAVAEARPTPSLSPLLKDLVNRTESWESVRPKIEKCPKCGNDRFSSVGWCLECGYSPAVAEVNPARKAKPLNSGWIILGGIVAVVLATAICHITLRVSGQNWIRWVWIETGLGLSAIVIGYIWNYYEVLPYYGDHTGNLTWNPLTLLSAGIHRLPKTRWALGLGSWGTTAVAATAFFVGDISYFWRFKVQVPHPTSSPLEFEKSDGRAASTGAAASESPKGRSKTTRTFFVVGTSGGEVILADHSIIDGSYKYAGRALINDSVREKVKQAQPRTEATIAGSTLTGVHWIDPFSWEVEFLKREDSGVLVEPALK